MGKRLSQAAAELISVNPQGGESVTVTSYDVFSRLLGEYHILIGGSTRSGKSVLINGLIAEVLLHEPSEMSMILIDPKGVELAPYRETAHCLRYACPNDGEDRFKDIMDTLKYAAEIMRERYKIMRGARKKSWQEGHIYIFVDEFGDLMTLAKREFKPLFTHLAQMGAAAGIHLIAATQCTLRSVVPTEVTINLTTKICLRVPYPLDSRRIIGGPGGELLTPGKALIVWLSNPRPELWEIPMYDEATLEALAYVKRASAVTG